jgi:hypothetical protein
MAATARDPAAWRADRISEAFCVAAERSEDSQTSPQFQGRQDDPGTPSLEALAASRDLALEEIVDAASLAESYSRSLAEAAWRGDRLTVEVSLRQLRACVVASIGFFKQLDGLEERGRA